MIADAGEPALRELLLGAAPPDYVALMAYLQPSEEFDAAPRRAARGDPRRDAAPRRRSATAPASCTRPASSTRAARRPGASCSCSTTAPTTSTIPGRPYRFTTLKEAQAIGDVQTLRELGLPAQRLRLQARTPRARCAP